MATPKKPAAKKAPAKKSSSKAAAAKSAPRAKAKASSVAGAGLPAHSGAILTLASLRPNPGSRPKRTRVGRGHGSGMVKTGGEGGKGQTVRSGGGKGPAFEGGQTPWARRLPHRRGYSQKSRNIGHFRSTYAVINLAKLADWDPKVEIAPETLKAAYLVKDLKDGVKILGGTKEGKTLPSGLRLRDVVLSTSAREALVAAGATLPEGA